MVMIRTKISAILHFAKASNQLRIEPRRFTETLFGGTNQRPRVSSCFVYGHANESKKISIASSLAPADDEKYIISKQVG